MRLAHTGRIAAGWTVCYNREQTPTLCSHYCAGNMRRSHYLERQHPLRRQLVWIMDAP
jgi:hypothetical protein